MPEPFVETYDALKQWLGKWAAVLWVGFVVATMLGFKLVGPSAEIKDLKEQIDSTKNVEHELLVQHGYIIEHEKREDRYMCLHSTKTERQLIPLDCK